MLPERRRAPSDGWCSHIRSPRGAEDRQSRTRSTRLFGRRFPVIFEANPTPDDGILKFEIEQRLKDIACGHSRTRVTRADLSLVMTGQLVLTSRVSPLTRQPTYPTVKI